MRELDWFNSFPPANNQVENVSHSLLDSASKVISSESSLAEYKDSQNDKLMSTIPQPDFSWNDDDTAFFSSKVSLILAADVIYIDECTDALVVLFRKLLHRDSWIVAKKCLIALEKRIKFTLDGIFYHFYRLSFDSNEILLLLLCSFSV